AGTTYAQDNPGDFTPEQPLTQDAINDLNPLAQFGDPSIDLSTPGAILSRVILFAFPIAGGILLIMLLWAGFEMVAGATEKKSQDAGRQRATAAVIGFILL